MLVGAPWRPVQRRRRAARQRLGTDAGEHEYGRARRTGALDVGRKLVTAVPRTRCRAILRRRPLHDRNATPPPTRRGYRFIRSARSPPAPRRFSGTSAPRRPSRGPSADASRRRRSTKAARSGRGTPGSRQRPSISPPIYSNDVAGAELPRRVEVDAPPCTTGRATLA